MTFHSRAHRRLVPGATILLSVLLGLAAAPQDEEASPAPGSSEPYRVKVELAVIQATVRDDDGELVRGLSRRDFVLLEDGEPRDIAVFSEEPEAPVQVAFLLDVSGSMALQNRLPMARGAIRYFLDRLDPDDEAALFVFAEGKVDVVADFTRDRRAITDGLLTREGYGQTALIDAVVRAPDLVPRRGKRRGAIILFSDGVDNISSLRLEQAMQLASRTEVPVYAVGLLDRQEARRRAQGAEALRRFARATGGEAYFADDYYEINKASRIVARELKQAYVLGYYPTPGPHRVQVEASCRGCVVSARQGLYADSGGGSR